MATPFEVIEQLAWGGLDRADVLYVTQFLDTGIIADEMSETARNQVRYILEAGLDATGVRQASDFLKTGIMGNDVVQTRTIPSMPVTAAPTAAPTTPPTGPTAEQRSAKAIIDDTLSQWNLAGLGDRVWNAVTSGEIVPEQLASYVRKQPEWKAEFGVIDQLAQKGRAISESEVIGLRRQFAQTARAAGLPTGFYDSNDDFDKWIGGETSPAEYARRVQLASDLIISDPTVAQQLGRFAGDVSVGDLTAVLLDPNRALPLLEQQVQGAKLSGAAVRTGFGALSAAEATHLAQIGVTEDQAASGLSTLASSRELYGALNGGEETISRDTQLSAVFDRNAQAIDKLNRRARSRTAVFEGGGSFASGKGGLAGIGSAS